MFWKLDVFHGGARVGLGFEVVISKLEYYTIIFYINIYLNGKYQQYIINDYLKRILKCEI